MLLTVKELIEKLSTLDPNAHVGIKAQCDGWHPASCLVTHQLYRADYEGAANRSPQLGLFVEAKHPAAQMDKPQTLIVLGF
jgi:hypothetical protein